MGYRRELNRIGAEAWFVLAGWFVFQFAFSGLWFTLFNLYLVRLGYTARFIGSLHGTASFAFALMSVPAGLLGARLGSRKMMIAGLCITAVFRILFLILTGPANPGDFSAIWPMTTYMAAALGSSIYMVNSVPALSAATDITTRGLVFSVSTAASGLGTFTGSLVGGIIPSAVSRLSRVGLSDPAPYRAALFLVPLLMIVSAGLVTLVRERTAEQSSATKAPASARTRPWGLIIGVSAIWFLLRASLGPVFYFFNIYLDHTLSVPVSMIGTVIAVASLTSIPVALTTSLITNRLGRLPVVKLSMLAVVAGYLILSIQSWWTAALAYVVIIGALSIGYAAWVSFSQDAAGPAHREVMSGFNTNAAALGMVMITFGGGAIIERLGYRTLFLCAATLPILVIVVSSLLPFGRGSDRPPSS